MLENIRLSFQGIWSHKMRSFLTMLGIIIGIASIISIVSTIQGTNEQLMQNVIGAGNNAVSIPLSRSSDYEMSFDYESVPYGVPVIGEDTREKLLEVDGVEDATFYTSRTYADSIYHQNTALQGANVYGIDTHYFNVNGYVIRTGRGFVEEDYMNFRKVVILDQTAASSLFQEESAIGKTIEINSEPFTVIGVAQVASQFEPVINSMEDYYTYMGYDSGSGTVFMPSSAWCIAYQYDEPQHVAVKAESVEAMTTIGKPCADILNENLYTTDSDLKYRAKNTLETVEQQQQINESTNQQLIWIASISLLVGGIGVMNIMLVSVTERTSEIGLKKAIGAKKRAILMQFLTEAAVLTSMGGVLGVVAGIGMAQAISRMADVPVAINIPATIIAVLFSMVIGLIFGFMPSIKAANLNPIDALRHE
ncbi:efflux ABC transporter, permease protein [Marvinbryantia formatexigens DSM 14469]|uniref:Efflux ABC transporter, permease protein n=1 Tax=Marvinbryantia formatexigens DSM 14469 TaxID=478749 RepID=C6LBZ5_9FIRM|nr:ABC transporter permease [Marvinbryantia formatexigens]EET61948.1 efflux ABC transporter, permease protein [Marvinbryantia formatexigens DSM 14469]UWO25715.1 ABC transporter permease [Marvinbryantia formatexigens DSM 14469]SDF33945.1 putative ABC transport system permease protein [Marvinbryantia formatexigens]